MKLSVGLITYNESINIERTLKAIISLADEIVIVDSHSTDETVMLAKQLGADVYTEDWKGFGAQKNAVIEKCQGEWILLIDADEVLSPELVSNIQQLICEDNSHAVYQLNRCSVCFNKELKYGGWSNDYVVRLFKKGSGVYSSDLVHEKFITSLPLAKLSGKIYHYSYRNMTDYIDRLNRYTTLGAQEYYKNGRKSNLIHICLSPIFKFIRMYIFKLGFLDGIEGFVIACTSALYTMIKYFKLREIYKNGCYLE